MISNEKVALDGMGVNRGLRCYKLTIINKWIKVKLSHLSSNIFILECDIFFRLTKLVCLNRYHTKRCIQNKTSKYLGLKLLILIIFI